MRIIKNNRSVYLNYRSASHACMVVRRLLFVIFLLQLFSPFSLNAKTEKNYDSKKKEKSGKSKAIEYLIDSTDNALDISGLLNSSIGFLPVPILITEPALGGFGIGGSLIYFHKNKEGRGKHQYGQLPPILSMAGGFYSANGSWAALVGHQGSYLNDRIRYLGVVGYIDIITTFYGAGFVDEGAYKFNMKGWLTFQELMFRVNKELPLFIGMNYVFFSNNVTFKTGLEVPGVEELKFDTNIGGLNTLVQWDSRDNSFTPNHGIFVALEGGYFSKALGGSSDYWNAALRTYYFTDKISKNIVAGFRFNWQGKWGEVPFYELPFISLRGIPALRYQDHIVTVVETEWRWRAWRRWSLVGFAGVGFTAPKIDKFLISEGKPAGGVGFRYLLAKSFNLHTGIDFARGPEEFAWYITIGSNWFR